LNSTWKFKHWWSSIPAISTKRTITSYLKWTHWTPKETTIYDIGNPCSGLGQAHKCSGVKSVNGIPLLDHLSLMLSSVADIHAFRGVVVVWLLGYTTTYVISVHHH